MNHLPPVSFTCFQIREENKWRLKEISGKFKMEESEVVNLMIENLHATVIEKAEVEKAAETVAKMKKTKAGKSIPILEEKTGNQAEVTENQPE